MFTGHVAAAFAGRGARSTAPLWYLVFASQAPDWLVVAGRLAGHEVSHVERFTETWMNFFLVALPLALIYFLVSRDLKASAVVWLVAASHPVFDFFTGSHTLLPGSQAPGLEWYHRPVHDFAIETCLIVASAFIYRKSLSPRAARSATFFLMFSGLVLVQASTDLYLASSRRNGWLSEEVNSARMFH